MRILIIFIFIKFNYLLSQNLISNSDFDLIISDNIDSKIDFMNWESVKSKCIDLGLDKTEGKLSNRSTFYYAPPLKEASISNIPDFINIYTNLENEAVNNFAYLKIYPLNDDGIFQPLNESLKKGYYFFSISVKQRFDTTNCNLCKIPLQVLISKEFTSPFDKKRKIKKGILITLPINEFGSSTNPWTKYNYCLKLKGGEKYISISNFSYPNGNQRFETDSIASNFSSDYYIDNVILKPIKNKDTIFPSIEKKIIVPSHSNYLTFNKVYYFTRLSCFGSDSPSIIGDKSMRLLDSITSILLGNKRLGLTIVLPSNDLYSSKKIGVEIAKYIDYYIENKKRISVEFTNEFESNIINETSIPSDCPNSYWKNPRLKLNLINLKVGLKFKELSP